MVDFGLIEAVEFFLAGLFLIKLYQENAQSYANIGQIIITPDKLGWFFIAMAAIFVILSLKLNKINKISKYFLKYIYPYLYATLFSIMIIEIFTAIFEFHSVTPTSVASAVFFMVVLIVFFYTTKKILFSSRMLLNINFAFILLTLALVLLKYPIQQLILIFFVIVFINLGVGVKQFKQKLIFNKSEKLIRRLPLILSLTTILIILTPFFYIGFGKNASVITLVIAAISLCFEITFNQPKTECQISYLNKLGGIKRIYKNSKNLILSDLEFDDFKRFCSERGFDLSYYSVDFFDSINEMKRYEFGDPYVIKLVKHRFTVTGIPYTVAEWQQEEWRRQLPEVQRDFLKGRAIH